MAETERTTFQVTATGIGRPDYSPAIAASKLITDTLQTIFSYSVALTVAAGGAWGLTVYTVPAGFKLNIGSVVVTCEASMIQRFHLYRMLAGVSTFILDNLRYDVNKSVVFGPESVVEIPAGAVLHATVFNGDALARNFSLTLSGFLEQVG